MKTNGIHINIFAGSSAVPTLSVLIRPVVSVRRRRRAVPAA